MSKGELLYMKGMNQSSASEEDDFDNIWDDCKLNEAYDVAVSLANAEIAKRFAMSTNNRKPIPAPTAPVTAKKSKSTSKHGKSSATKCPSPSTKWAAGMPCRAVFEDDGQEYEAFLLKTINDKECVVRFLGYENSEIVSISTLKPSLGDKERARQIQEALSDCTVQPETDQMEYESDRAHSTVSEKSHHKKKSNKKKNKKSSNMFELPTDLSGLPGLPPLHMSQLKNLNLGSMEIPLPPPPATFAQCERPDSEQQAITSMLISWYMSGYYTGLYQGMKRTKHSTRHHH